MRDKIKHPVDIMSNVKQGQNTNKSPVAVSADVYTEVLRAVSSGDYNKARDILKAQSKEVQASIKINIALTTQVML